MAPGGDLAVSGSMTDLSRIQLPGLSGRTLNIVSPGQVFWFWVRLVTSKCPTMSECSFNPVIAASPVPVSVQLRHIYSEPLSSMSTVALLGQMRLESANHRNTETFREAAV